MAYNRRQLLTAAAGTGAVSLVGCVGDGGEADTNETPAGDGDSSGDDGGSSPTISVVQPSDGATVAPPVTISGEVSNFELVSADTEPRVGAGHAHVLIDQGSYEVDEQIPFEDGYVHLSEGARTATLEADQLDPGEQRLTMQLANSNHVAVDASDTITVTVDAGSDGGDETDDNDDDEDGDGDGGYGGGGYGG